MTPAVMTKVGPVHALSAEDAGRHIPLRLRGVVTALPGWKDSFFLQDATGGLAVDRKEHSPVRDGDLVEVIGTSNPGLFSASVDESAVRVLGRAAMPRARLYNYPELEGGEHDAEWIEVRGIVQSAHLGSIWGNPVLVLRIEIGGGMIDVRFRRYTLADPARLVDALVRVRGVCGTIYNEKRQFTGLRLFAGDTSAIEVEEPAPGDPFAGETMPVRSVMQADHKHRARHRVKIEGIVTYQEPGQLLYVQDGTDGILLTSDQNERVAIGSRVEVVGFPALANSSPKLQNGIFRVIGPPHPIQPALIQAKDFLRQRSNFTYTPYDGQLVRLRAEVVSPLALPTQYAWLLRDRTGDFAAYLPHSKEFPPPQIANGTIVSVTGVFAVMLDDDGQPRGFRILMRDPQDMVVLERASWWTSQHLIDGLLMALAMAAGSALWVMMLRKRVREQTQRLRESEERFREQAQHDTLTGLASRSYLQEKLEEAIEEARRTGERVGVLMVDLDHFKQINDTLGHHVGDELLRIVAERLRAAVRKGDIVARMGGDEFVVLLLHVRNLADAEAIGAKVVSSVSAPAVLGSRTMKISGSVGVCTYPEGGADGDALLQSVDAQMYKAKAAGRNSLCVFDPGDLSKPAMSSQPIAAEASQNRL